MKVSEIYNNSEIKVFTIVNQHNEDILEWEVEATQYDVLPNEENHFLVKGLKISDDGTTEVYMNMLLPERISEIALEKEEDRKIEVLNIYTSNDRFIPLVACESYGNYELYYLEDNPIIGINILKTGLDKSNDYGAIAEDLGYIYRDEQCINEAIEAFKISESVGVSSLYIYKELTDLYEELSNTQMREEYNRKYNEAI